MKIFIKFIFLLSLISGIFLSQLQADEVAPKTKIYFVKARLDKVVSVHFASVNKTVDLLSLTVIGPSSQEYKGFEWTETVAYDPDGPKNIFLVHEETAPNQGGVLQKNTGKIFEGVALSKIDQPDEEKLPEEEKKILAKIHSEIYFPFLKKDQPVYLNFGGVQLNRFLLPSSPSSFYPSGNSILPAVKSFFDFFDLKTLGFSLWQKNSYIPFMARLLGSINSMEAVNMAFEYDIADLVWSRSWLKLPGMFEHLLGLCSEKKRIDRVATWLWDISSEKAFSVIVEKTKNDPLRSSLFSSLMGDLPYPKIYDYVFSEYEKLPEEDKLLFLKFYFDYVYIHDEYIKNFILKETENVKNKYTKFDNFIKKDGLLKNFERENEIFDQRKKQNLYDLKTLAEFSIKYAYDTKQEMFAQGLRLKAEGSIKYNSGSFMEVLVQAGTHKIFFKLPLTTEQESLFKDKKAGDTVAFEGIIDDLGSATNNNEALITLSHVLIPPSHQ